MNLYKNSMRTLYSNLILIPRTSSIVEDGNNASRACREDGSCIVPQIIRTAVALLRATSSLTRRLSARREMTHLSDELALNKNPAAFILTSLGEHGPRLDSVFKLLVVPPPLLLLMLDGHLAPQAGTHVARRGAPSRLHQVIEYLVKRVHDLQATLIQLV